MLTIRFSIATACIAWLAAGVLAVCGAPALAAQAALTDAMMAPINANLAGINAGDPARFKGLFTATASIVDEVPPYRWTGGDAGAKWWTDFGTWAKMSGLSNVHGTFGKPRYWDVRDNRAYVVIPTTFAGDINGKPGTESGMWTFVIVKMGTAWKIDVSCWATTQLTGE